jgi:hypothetical protein
MASISAIGKRSLSGIPPAKEMIPGLVARLIKSRISDERKLLIDFEKFGIISE